MDAGVSFAGLVPRAQRVRHHLVARVGAQQLSVLAGA